MLALAGVTPSPHSSLRKRATARACARFSRAYIRHLFMADEMLGASLLSRHNVHFLVALMREARDAIRAGTFDGWSREWLARHHSRPATVS